MWLLPERGNQHRDELTRVASEGNRQLADRPDPDLAAANATGSRQELIQPRCD